MQFAHGISCPTFEMLPIAMLEGCDTVCWTCAHSASGIIVKYLISSVIKRPLFVCS